MPPAALALGRTRPGLVPADLAAAVGGHPLVATLLARRGITTPAAARAFLDPDCYTPRPPSDLPGMDAAVRRILAAIAAQEPIGVWGDFDVDGVTAATVLQESLLAAGALVQWVHIPAGRARATACTGPPWRPSPVRACGLVITCDTGITATRR